MASKFQHAAIFKSRRDMFVTTVVLGTLALLVGLPAYGYLDSGVAPGWPVYLISGVTTGFMLWLWFDTHYRIDTTYVHYRSGPFRGKIAIDTIREVEKGATMWSGLRPALARKGIVVKYNKYDEIYFSPDTNDTFIQALLDVKGDILVIDNLKH